MSVKRTCAGCQNKFLQIDTSKYRNKTWCGSGSCREIIDEKVKHKNYKRKEKKINNGTWRIGLSKDHRISILVRDSYRCARCLRVSENFGVMQVHHIVPVSEGGTDDNVNLITVCDFCHTKIHQIGWEVYVEPFTTYAKNMEKNNKT